MGNPHEMGIRDNHDADPSDFPCNPVFPILPFTQLPLGCEATQRYIRPDSPPNPHLFTDSCPNRGEAVKQAVRDTHQTTQTSKWTVLAILIALTVVIRVPGIGRALVGNFSTKNVVYAMIGRNWAEGRAGIFFPRLDCLTDGQRSLHMLEFPVSAYLAATAWKTAGGSLDVWGRATSVAFITASVILLLLFVRRRHGLEAALGAGFCLALSPISVIYGQSFMLEASLICFTVATFYFLDRWLLGGRAIWLAMSAACFALLLLTKIYMLVLLLPLGIAVIHAKLCRSRPETTLTRSASEVGKFFPRLRFGLVYDVSDLPGSGISARRKLAAGLLLGLAIVPAATWYWHAYHAADPGGPYADHIFYSVRDSASVHRPPHPILRSADFYRQMLDDLTGVVLTPVGFMLLLAGFLDRESRRYGAWLAAMGVLVLLLPLKFHEMNYYHMAVLPPLCVIAGLGWRVVHRRIRPTATASVLLVLVGLIFSARYSGRAAFVTPHEDRAVVAAGRAVQQLAEADEPVVTMHGSTIDLLYYSNRPGWALSPDTPNLNTVLEDYHSQGARYLVVTGPQADGPPPAVTRLPVAAWGQGYLIHALKPKFHGDRD